MTAQVEGVLSFNNAIRDNMLSKNIGKYSQLTSVLNPAIGEYYNIDNYHPLFDLKDGKDMLSFTHDGNSPYSSEIKRKYFSFGEEEPYYVRSLTYDELNPWLSYQRGNYIKYIDEVFGKDEVMRHVDYINNLLSGRFIENALRQTEVGVIRDINVPVALQGIVTTNPNNLSGEDTMLGKISNRMYAQTLYNGAIFNSDRMNAKIRDGENYYSKAYLTPYLVNKYGNNLPNVTELSDIMKIGTNETHIREDLGANVHILDGYTENNFADLSSPEFRILNEQIKNAIDSGGYSKEASVPKYGYRSVIINEDGLIPRSMYTLEKNYGYVNSVKGEHDFRYENLNFEDVDGDGLESQKTKGGRLYGKYTINIYNEAENDKRLADNEAENDKRLADVDDLNYEGNEENTYDLIDDDDVTLLSKTSKLFHEKQIDTLIGRFHTDRTKYGFAEFTDTARSTFGNSHGRNLLRLDAEGNPLNETNGYDNPYCRTWTYHHQYNKISRLIRPFTLEMDDLVRPYTIKEIQSLNKKYRAFRNDTGFDADVVIGYERLASNTVLQNNGFVRITPKAGIDKQYKIKNCMFSIENLAWKDVFKYPDNLSVEQTGPNGGRIMWFPPYDLDFQEAVNVDWSQNTFIGRGEKVYTYTNTDRTGTLSFSLLIDHPAIINSAASDGYKGKGKEQDPEADILRFFAGCELLPEIDKLDDTDKNKEKKPDKKTIKKHIKFKIYFPNNFSGVITNKRKKDGMLYDQFNKYVLSGGGVSGGIVTDKYDENYANDYWWQYILVGNNTCVTVDENDFRGYEILPIDKVGGEENEKNCGLSNDETKYTNKPLPTCVDNQKIEGDISKVRDIEGYRISCKTEVLNKDILYYYFVDEDLHQKLPDAESHKDKNSFRLNVSFENVGERQDDEFTFVEVILALLKINEDSEKYGPLYNKYFNYFSNNIFNTVKGHDPLKNYEKLVSLFTDENVTFKKITYRGSADRNNSINSKMLAFRRGTVGSELIKTLLVKRKEKGEIEVASKTPIASGKSGVPAYVYSQKKNRYCYFDIEYEVPATDYKDDSNNRKAEDVTSPNIFSFKEYLNAITEFSPLLDAYTTLIMGEYPDYNTPIDNNELRFNLENKYLGLQSRDRKLLDNEKFLRKQIDDIIDKYVNRDAIILAYAVADSETNYNFRVLYDNIPLLKDDDSSSSNCRFLGDNDLDLKYIFAYLFGHGANKKDYYYTGDDNDKKFTYYVPKCLFKYKDEFTHIEDYKHIDDYTISMNKILVPILLSMFIKPRYDKVNEFGIFPSELRMQYLCLFCELLHTTTEIPNITMDALIKNRCNIPFNIVCEFFSVLITEDVTYESINKLYEIARKNDIFYDLVDDFILSLAILLNQTLAITADDDLTEVINPLSGITIIHDDSVEYATKCLVTRLNEKISDDEKARQDKEAEDRAQNIEETRKQSQADKEDRFNKEYVYAYGPDLSKVPNNRYETEGEYFRDIDIKDPILYKNLKNKFKYFNPAYHSISPEGFNARLTFLHQCTRQGQTVEAKVKNGNRYTGNASNLAFGRMPVCVIRIGDFINTRAIINSMSITYAAANGMVWDLNSEGSGVQPMYAKVSLQITLLGGQSLEAPISRLQNAISFNYYANTEVYDNRSDIAEYEPGGYGENGYVKYKRIWSPLSREYKVDENGQMAKTGKLINNETDDFVARHTNDGTWKDLTDEQIADKFNDTTNPGGETLANDLVYSREMTSYVLNYNDVLAVMEGFIETITINIYCNRQYRDTNYIKTKYIEDNVTYGNLVFKKGVENREYVLNSLKTAVRNAINSFIQMH